MIHYTALRVAAVFFLTTLPLLFAQKKQEDPAGLGSFADRGGTFTDTAIEEEQEKDRPHLRAPDSVPPGFPEELKAQVPKELPPNLPSEQELREQLALLERFLELPPDQLARIRRTIETIEAMEPEEKEAMLSRLRAVRSLAPQEQVYLRIITQSGKPEDRATLRAYWVSIPPPKRLDFQQKLQAMTEEERRTELARTAETFRNKADSSASHRDRRDTGANESQGDSSQTSGRPSGDQPEGSSTALAPNTQDDSEESPTSSHN